MKRTARKSSKAMLKVWRGPATATGAGRRGRRDGRLMGGHVCTTKTDPGRSPGPFRERVLESEGQSPSDDLELQRRAEAEDPRRHNRRGNREVGYALVVAGV